MPTTKSKQLELQGAMTLAEIDVLRRKIIDLEQENAELTADNEALKKQIHNLTDPAKTTDAANFRKARGRA